MAIDRNSRQEEMTPSVENGAQVRLRPASLSRLWMGLLLLISDTLSLLMAVSLALFIWSFVRADLEPVRYFGLLPILLVFVLAYALVGLYPAVGISPIEELRRLTISTTAVFLLLGTLSFYMRNVEQYSRAAFGISWLILLVLAPLNRKIIRSLGVSGAIWGEPVAIIGYGDRGSQIIKFLYQNPKLGFRPVVIIDGFTSAKAPPAPVPLYQRGNLDPNQIPELSGIDTAFLLSSEVPKEFLSNIIEGRWHNFHHLIMVADEQASGSVWVYPHDIGGLLGLEVRQNLYSSFQQSIKRLVDLSLVVLFSPFLATLFGVLSIFIRLDSPGPVLYRHKRVGQGGKDLYVWKFRSMVCNADDVLEHHLEANPHLRKEWNTSQKLKNDPRITRMGKWLRRFSLDELPQLINILKGEMSLVGPRPIVEEEIKYYRNRYHLYSWVKPGLTGMWQVSGRNDTSYEMRVLLDEYYVRNWSIWMDIYILAKTIYAVLSGKGAY